MRKSFCLPILVVLLLSTFAAAIDFMGPPTATLSGGQFKPDFTYHYSENDAILEDIDSPVDFGRIDAEDLYINRYYSTFTYGLNDRWEAYGKAGAGTVGDSDTGFAYGWGTRVTAIDGDDVDWGVGFLMSWLDDADDDGDRRVCIQGERHSGDFDWDLLEIQAVAGPTIHFDGWKLYGGVFYYALEGDWDATVTGPTLMAPVRMSGDLDEDADVGGYVGSVIDLATNSNMMIETAFINGGWAVGANIAWLF